MDIWMVAVAAAGGYIAKHFKKCKQTGEQITSESSSFNSSLNDKLNSPKYPPDKKWPFRRSIKKQDDSKVKSEVSQGVSTTEVTSTSEFDSVNGVISGNCEGSSVFSPSTMFPCFVGSDNRLSEDMGTPRSRMLLRNRRAIKPLTSLESCLMAQLHTPFSSPSSKTTRPFLVTDGNNVINRSSGGTFIGSSEITQNDADAMLHVCIGMSFGILYSFMANRHEVEKLNRLLKQTESLVQDLEEEIEMKDSLVMQELTIDDHKSQRTDDGYNNLEQLTDSNNKEPVVIQKTKDESFSKIEAELEAELEMLELNMTSSTLERRISDLFEVDPDFEPDVAQGELRADMVIDNRNQDDSGSRSTTSSPPCANYAVSPRELSLRLHELLQWQLEERIRELEAEIESKSKNTQNHKSWKDLSSSDENPNPDTVDVDVDVDDEPVVLNLSGEALDAYNEACNEFAKFDDDSDEEEEEDDDDDGTPINGGSQNDDEDEMEKLLIKHIVEKARQGSPMVLNAQRALFSE